MSSEALSCCHLRHKGAADPSLEGLVVLRFMAPDVVTHGSLLIDSFCFCSLAGSFPGILLTEGPQLREISAFLLLGVSVVDQIMLTNFELGLIIIYNDVSARPGFWGKG